MRKLTALLVLVLVVGCNAPKVSVELKGQTAIPAPPRYQIVINTHKYDGGNTEAFLLDTERGRVWMYRPFDELKQMVNHFYPIEIVDNEGVIGQTPKDWFSLNALLKAKRDAKETEAFISAKQAEEEAGKRDSAKHE